MRELVVALSGVRVGRLIQKDNGNLQFRYDDGYGGSPVSFSMPVRPEAHPHRRCVAVFGGLLLEGDGRETLAKTLGVSERNDFALLEEVGRDVAGALTILEQDEPLPERTELRRVTEEELDRMLRSLPQRPLAVDPQEGIRLSLAGAQPKLPVILDDEGVALPLNAATPTTHILKPEPAAYPGLVDNEHYCMALASEAGLLTAAVRKETSASGLPYLVVERYDRDLMADPIRRLHQEDFCQALGVPSEFKYQNEGGPSFGDAVGLLRDAAAAPVIELPRLWEALAYNWLIGNCDAHGKNYSLLYDAGTPTLAPLYDLVSTVLHPELNKRLAMSIDGATTLDAVDDAAWTHLARDVHVRPDFARQTVRRVAERAAAAAARIAADHDTAPARAIATRVTVLAEQLRG